MYPDGYKIKGIADQVASLRHFFPALNGATFDENIATKPLPPNVEGWFAIPKWKKLSSSYASAVDMVLSAIESKMAFDNYGGCRCRIGPNYLSYYAERATEFHTPGDFRDDFDICIVPCKFGLRRRNNLVRPSSEAVSVIECDLSTFAAGCMILTHLEQVVKWEPIPIEYGHFGISASPPDPRIYAGGWVWYGPSECDHPDYHNGIAAEYLAQ